jgi:hypothetical protein
VKSFIIKFIRARVKEGEMLPRWARVIFWIIEPLKSFLSYQKVLNVDFCSQCLIVHGQKISFDFLERLAQPSPHGEWFRVEPSPLGLMVCVKKEAAK